MLVKRIISVTAPEPDDPREPQNADLEKITGEMIDWVTSCFNACLMSGVFPSRWKRANLVLIPKEQKAYAIEPDIPHIRSICLLDDIGKALKRILANSIILWQADHPESAFSASQYGFRRGRSTCDALLLVQKITKDIINAGAL